MSGEEFLGDSLRRDNVDDGMDRLSPRAATAFSCSRLCSVVSSMRGRVDWYISGFLKSVIVLFILKPSTFKKYQSFSQRLLEELILVMPLVLEQSFPFPSFSGRSQLLGNDPIQELKNSCQY